MRSIAALRQVLFCRVVTRRLFLLAAVAAAALYAEDFAGKVVAISDGDTIRVMHNGASERIRLGGSTAPR